MRAASILTRRRLLWGGLIAVVLAAVLFLWQPLAVEWRLHRARRGLQTRDNQRALDELRAALRMAPDRAETHFLLARTHRRLGNLDMVPSLLRRATKLGGDPERAQRETWLLAAQSGDLLEAEQHLDDLLMDPRGDGADICQAYVQGFFSNLRVAEATRLLDAWEKQFPQDPQPHFMRAFLLEALNRSQDSAAAYRRGLELDPENTTMRYRLAHVLAEMRQFDEAAELLLRCVEEDPANPDVLTTQADCLFAQGAIDEARGVLDRLLADAPDHFDALRLSGEIELSQGRFEQAVRRLQPAIDQRPYDTTSHNALGQALRALGRADEARPHFDYVAEAEQRLTRMERQMLLVIERPHDAELRYEIGATLLQYGSPDDGAKWLATVLQFDPGHAKAHQALAVYYEARGDLKRALFHRRAGSGTATGDN